jgi:ribokinase
MARVCVVGSSNVDLTFRTPRLPRPGETLAGTLFHLGYGGKGGNQAVMAARLGAQGSLVSRVGHDPFGEQLLRNYRTEGIDTTHVQLDADRHTGTAAIVVDDQAQNCIIVVPGANENLAPDDVRAAAGAIQRADVVVCQLEIPVESVLEAFQIAKAQGVRTILNPAPAVALPEALLRLTDFCVPNETEIEGLTGKPAHTTKQAEKAARALRDLGPQTVIVTLGDRGALLLHDNGAEHFPPVSATAVDPSGAGDAFIGSLAVLLANDQLVRDAVRGANQIAGFTVTRHGTQSSFPSRTEVGDELSGLFFPPENH